LCGLADKVGISERRSTNADSIWGGRRKTERGGCGRDDDVVRGSNYVVTPQLGTGAK